METRWLDGVAYAHVCVDGVPRMKAFEKASAVAPPSAALTSQFHLEGVKTRDGSTAPPEPNHLLGCFTQHRPELNCHSFAFQWIRTTRLPSQRDHVTHRMNTLLGIVSCGPSGARVKVTVGSGDPGTFTNTCSAERSSDWVKKNG